VASALISITMVDANLRTVEPQGLARVLLGVFIFFLITTAVVVILRCFVRLRHRIFGIDDSLMLIGWVSSCHDYYTLYYIYEV
jgi:hypothetical protein